MSKSTYLTSSTPLIDEDLAEQVHRGHGVPSQDPDPAAQLPLQPEEAKPEANSVLVGGSSMAGAATGAIIGAAAAGPGGVVVGAAVGAVVGALGGAVAGVAASPEDGNRADTVPEFSTEFRSSPQKEFNLKTFVLSPEMLTFSGVFYPAGYVVVMFLSVYQAEQAALELISGGYDGEAIMLLPPETILREITPVAGDDSTIGLPSVGTESATAQKYIKLAREGQFGLMVHAETDNDTEVVMSVVRSLPFSYAQKYHILAMEDLK